MVVYFGAQFYVGVHTRPIITRPRLLSLIRRKVEFICRDDVGGGLPRHPKGLVIFYILHTMPGDHSCWNLVIARQVPALAFCYVYVCIPPIIKLRLQLLPIKYALCYRIFVFYAFK